MDSIVDFAIKRVRSYVREAGFSIPALSEKVNLPYSTVNDFLKDDSNPTVATVRKMEHVVPKDYMPVIGLIPDQSRTLNKEQSLTLPH